MVPFSSFARTHWTYGSPKLAAFNGRPSVQIQGVAAPGKSTGDAMQALEAMVADLLAGIGLNGAACHTRSGNPARYTDVRYRVGPYILRRQHFMSWAIPLAGHSGGATGCTGCAVRAQLFGLSNDAVFQGGFGPPLSAWLLKTPFWWSVCQASV